MTGIVARSKTDYVGYPELDKLLAFITGAGFSVFVSCWFMLKHDRSLQELTSAIIELRAVLQIQFSEGGKHGGNKGT